MSPIDEIKLKKFELFISINHFQFIFFGSRRYSVFLTWEQNIKDVIFFFFLSYEGFEYLLEMKKIANGLLNE